MQITYSKFEHELNRFLKTYLEDDSFDHLKERLYLSEHDDDPISVKINTFYNNQLQLDKNYSGDRVKVDRIITFSERRLQPEKFCKFLIDLGRICLSEGKMDLATEIFRKSNKLTKDDLTKADSLLGVADVFSRKAIWPRSLEAIKKAMSIYKSKENFKGVARCENFLGTIYGELGNILKAKKHLLTSLSLINTNDDVELAANIYVNLGIIYNIQKSPDDAINNMNKALDLYKKTNNMKNISKVYLNIGLVYYDSGNNDSSLIALDEAIRISKDNGFLSLLCFIYLAKAQVLISFEDYHYALEFANSALELSHNLDDKLTLADIYRVKGIVERNLGNFGNAETYLLNSLRINDNLNNEFNSAETSIELGLLYEKMSKSNLMNSYLEKSQQYFRNIGATGKVERIEEILGFSAS